MVYDMYIIICIIFVCILCEFFGIKSKKKKKLCNKRLFFLCFMYLVKGINIYN